MEIPVLGILLFLFGAIVVVLRKLNEIRGSQRELEKHIRAIEAHSRTEGGLSKSGPAPIDN